MEFAVPSVSLDARARFMGDAAPGSIPGELIRSTVMYKNFALSFSLNQYRRVMAKPTTMDRAKYVANIIGGMTVLGGLAVQLKELAKGRDPRDMTEGRFWAAAAFQGGGLGLFGDFAYSETNRVGGGLYETLGGPVVGLGSDLIGGVVDNTTRALSDKDTRVGRDVSQLVRRYTPGTNLWFARAALDRLVWDQMQEFLDPDAEQVWRRSEKARARAYGNKSWWAPGDALPDRGPDFTNILGG